MIRFACQSCQKILSAPEDKAGLRFACPSCKNQVVVPAASRTSQLDKPAAASSAPPSPIPVAPATEQPLGQEPARRSFARRLPALLLSSSMAALRQTLKPFTLAFEIQRRNRLRRKAGEAHFALGQRLNEAHQGDPKLRSRIKALGERIHSIQDVRGDAREQIAERKALMLQLAEPVLAAETAPETVEGEHERARTTRDKLQAQEKALGGAFGGLLPPHAAAWGRTFLGYTVLVLLGLGGWQAYGLATRGARLAQEREAQLAAAKTTEDKKREEEDILWSKERDSEQIVEKCGPSVALIRFKVGKRDGGGTGFMIRPGVIATNAHVIDSVFPEELKVYFPSAKELAKTSYAARVLFFDRKRDLAFLAVEPKVPPLRLADNFEFKSGKRITIIGCPGIGEMQLENAVTTGLLSTKTEFEKMPFYQLAASVNPGNSGGPVFDNRGQIIGVVTLKASQESIAFCIPWQDLKDRVESLEKDDPHRIAASAQSMHSLHVVVDRVFLSSMIYGRIMSTLAASMRDATARGRPAAEGVAKAQPIMDAFLRKFTPFLVEDKHRTISVKLMSDPNIPDEVRRKFGDLWNTYEEFKQNVNKTDGGIVAYTDKAHQLENRFRTQVDSLRESLGMESPKVDDGDGLDPEPSDRLAATPSGARDARAPCRG